MLNDEDSGNELLGDDGSNSKKQADQDKDDRSEIEVEVTNAEYYENSAKEFMMTMDVTTSIDTINKTIHKTEIEEDRGKMECLAASIVFPLSKFFNRITLKALKCVNTN